MADNSVNPASKPLALALCKLHQREHCVLVSSAGVGLTLTFRALGLESARIAIPAGVCLDVPLAIKSAGATPVYCDIDPQTLGLTPETLSQSNQEFDAVLAVHAYGNACGINALTDYCEASDIPLIEDVAAAQGGQVDARPLGSFGDASVLSFGRGKIVDIGGGGAVLTDDASLALEIGRKHQQLPSRTEAETKQMDEFSLRHTELYNQHYGGSLKKHLPPFLDIADKILRVFSTQKPWDYEAALQGIDRLDRNLSSRRLLAEYLFERIEAGTQMIHCHRSALDSVFWRANILVPATRNLVLHALLKEKCKVSSWFPPAHEFLEQEWLGVTPIADQVGREILNVWVNDEADTSYIAAIAENICVMTASKHHESRQPTASSP